MANLVVGLSISSDYDYEATDTPMYLNKVEQSFHLVSESNNFSIDSFNDFDFENHLFLEIGFYFDEEDNHYQTSHRIYQLTVNNEDEEILDTLNILQEHIGKILGLEHLPFYSITEQESVLDRFEKILEEDLIKHKISMFEILNCRFVGSSSPKNNLEIRVASPKTRNEIGYFEIPKKEVSSVFRLFNKETGNRWQVSFKEDIHNGLEYYNFKNITNAFFKIEEEIKYFNPELFT